MGHLEKENFSKFHLTKKPDPCKIVPTGEVSNFLREDFAAVWKFMNAAMLKKKRKI
jgi:hypothetical protein